VVAVPERPIAADDVVDALLLEVARAGRLRGRGSERVNARDGAAQQSEADGEGGERHRVRHHGAAHRSCVKEG
jgi:hypothetical protein